MPIHMCIDMPMHMLSAMPMPPEPNLACMPFQPLLDGVHGIECIDMCTGMCTDMCIDNSIGMRWGMCCGIVSKLSAEAVNMSTGTPVPAR